MAFERIDPPRYDELAVNKKSSYLGDLRSSVWSQMVFWQKQERSSLDTRESSLRAIAADMHTELREALRYDQEMTRTTPLERTYDKRFNIHLTTSNREYALGLAALTLLFRQSNQDMATINQSVFVDPVRGDIEESSRVSMHLPAEQNFLPYPDALEQWYEGDGGLVVRQTRPWSPSAALQDRITEEQLPIPGPMVTLTPYILA